MHSIAVRPFWKRKDLAEAERKRLEGNRLYEARDYASALMLYSQSLVKAPVDDGPSLVLWES